MHRLHRYQTDGLSINASPVISIAFNTFIGQRCLSSPIEIMQDAMNIAANTKINEIIRPRRTPTHHGSFLNKSNSSIVRDEFRLKEKERKWLFHKQWIFTDLYHFTLHSLIKKEWTKKKKKEEKSEWKVCKIFKILKLLSIWMSRSVLNNYFTLYIYK